MGHAKSGYRQLDGTYIRVLRSPKFKTKGLILQVQSQEIEIFLPKKLRMLLTLELQLGDPLRILTETKKEKLVAVNIMKLADMAKIVGDQAPQLAEIPAVLDRPTQPNLAELQPQSVSGASQVIKICRKGTCRKRGSLQLLQQWQTEAERNPSLGVTCQLTGCLKRCKAGVNIRVGDRVVSHAQNASLAAIVQPL